MIPVARRRRQTQPVTIGEVLRRAFTTLVVLVVVAGLAGALATVPAFLAISGPLNEINETRAGHIEVRSALIDGQSNLNGYLLTGDASYRASYAENRSRYPAVMARLRATAAPLVPGLIGELDRQAARWWKLADQQIAGASGLQPSGQQVRQLHEQFARTAAVSRRIDSVLSARATKLNRTNDRLNAAALAVVIVTTVLGVLWGMRIGRSATRRVTTPLGQVLRVVDRLGRGEHDARVALTEAPAEIAEIAAAINATALAAAEERWMFDAVQRLGVAVRRHLTRAEAVAVAAQGIGELLRADHVVVRLSPGEDWPPAPYVWSSPDAVGDPSLLAGTPADRTAAGPAGMFACDTVPDSGSELSEQERAGLRQAGAGSAITVAFGAGTEVIGHLTVIRRHGRGQGRMAWRPAEVPVASMITADLGRALTQARLFEQAHELVAQLREVDAAKTEFVSTVSHELRTPLTSVSGYLEVLLDQDAGELTPTQDRMLRVIDRNVERLRLLIEDLLLVSRIEAGRFVITTEPVDLRSVVESVCQAIQPAADKGGVTLTSEVADTMAISGDPEHLERAVLNVISNAVKFTPAGGTVTVTGHTDGPDAVLVIRDTGIGIPAADLASLFTRFFRAGNATRLAIPGTGLGLAIVSTIVELHGGTVTIDSEEGAGTTATIRLPSAGAANDSTNLDQRTGVHGSAPR